MQISIQALALTWLRGAALLLPVSGMACSLVPPDALLLKQMMVKEIAFRLAIDVEQVPLNDITAPALHRPLELGADCSGLAAFHHSSGFRITVARKGQVFATMGKPHTATGAAGRYRDRLSSGFYAGRQWAGVSRNLWRAPRARAVSEADYSGYMRWPQYPREDAFQAPSSDVLPVQRWPQYPHESQFPRPSPNPSAGRWSTFGRAANPDAAQGACRYEGVAVVLGPDGSSPVAVNFRQQCD